MFALGQLWPLFRVSIKEKDYAIRSAIIHAKKELDAGGPHSLAKKQDENPG